MAVESAGDAVDVTGDPAAGIAAKRNVIMPVPSGRTLRLAAMQLLNACGGVSVKRGAKTEIKACTSAD